MRVFAGPNGSGKTTIFKGMLHEKDVSLGIYVNADDIEEQWRKHGFISFDSFGLRVSEDQIRTFFKNSHFAPIKRGQSGLWKTLHVEHNKLKMDLVIDSYIAADLAEYIRQQLLIEGKSFTYETVMSHPEKITFLKRAQDSGYRVYLYYVATEDPRINMSRVKLRMAQLGHGVSDQKIKERYFRSLGFLKDAVKYTNRTFLFDNSGNQAHFIGEITEGENFTFNQAQYLPIWVEAYLLIG